MSASAMKLVLLGAPNSGKTTLYNWLTGSKFRTVNYPGSTVEFSRGQTLAGLGANFEVIDTPGVRSLDPLSPDEEVTLDLVYQEAVDQPVMVIVPVDVTQLERHLFLASRVQQAGFATAICLTMGDMLREKGLRVDPRALESATGIPVFETDGRLGAGVRELVQGLAQNQNLAHTLKPVKLPAVSQAEVEKAYQEMRLLAEQVIRPYQQKASSSSSSNVSVREVLVQADPLTLSLDRWLMHPVLGLVGFVLIMATLFTSIFWAATPLMDLIDGTFAAWAESVASFGHGALWADFLGNGLIAGVGSVLVFLPQIVILFLALGLLEDSGYLARAAALVDKPLSAIGLNGRAFVPLLSGYACAIPAMMAARTIPNKKERLLTLFAIPLMSCSARLPVWALLLTLLFQGQALWAGLTLTAIYFASLLMGAVAVTVAARFIPNRGASWFMLELPAYRMPKIRVVLRNVLTRSSSYLKRAGGAIVVISVCVWALSTFPNYQTESAEEKLNSSYLAKLGQVLDPVMAPMGGDWRMGVGVLSAFAAREVFVSTMTVVFRVGDPGEDEVASLSSALQSATLEDGARMFTVSTLIGLIVYFMISLQCLPTVAVARAESGSRKFALVQLISFVLGGYVLAVLVVQGLRTLGIA